MTAPCLFFDKLPAEVRNAIYELAFTSDDDVITDDITEDEATENEISDEEVSDDGMSEDERSEAEISDDEISEDDENDEDEMPEDEEISDDETSDEEISDEEGQVELSKAKPPSKSLLLTCRQAYTEANQLYKSAYRDFWTKTSFKITCHCKAGKPRKCSLKSFDPSNEHKCINHITHLTIISFANDPRHTRHYMLIDPRGAWDTVDPLGSRLYLRLYLYRRRDDKEDITLAAADAIDSPKWAKELLQEIQQSREPPSLVEQMTELLLFSRCAWVLQ